MSRKNNLLLDYILHGGDLDEVLFKLEKTSKKPKPCPEMVKEALEEVKAPLHEAKEDPEDDSSESTVFELFGGPNPSGWSTSGESSSESTVFELFGGPTVTGWSTSSTLSSDDGEY